MSTQISTSTCINTICLQDGLRMIVSRDLDCTNTLYIQFSFKFITKGTRYIFIFFV